MHGPLATLQHCKLILTKWAPGEVNAVALQLTFGVPLCTHPGIVFKLTAYHLISGPIWQSQLH